MFVRYAKITNKLKREFVLLQGKGCAWRKCTYCDYHTDVSKDPYSMNKDVLRRVTGEFGVLDVINSGSAMELDSQTLALIQEIVKEKNIHTLWFEAHYLYRNHLNDFAKMFEPAIVKFRCGVETFDPIQRTKWHKGIPETVTPEQIAAHFSGICLLCCVQGQTRESIQKDIETAKKYFEYFSINLFCNNTTDEKRDDELVRWFVHDIFPTIKDDAQIDILLENTDLGVG